MYPVQTISWCLHHFAATVRIPAVALPTEQLYLNMILAGCQHPFVKLIIQIYFFFLHIHVFHSSTHTSLAGRDAALRVTPRVMAIISTHTPLPVFRRSTRKLPTFSAFLFFLYFLLPRFFPYLQQIFNALFGLFLLKKFFYYVIIIVLYSTLFGGWLWHTI